MTGRRVAHVVRSDGFAGVERYVCDTVTELARRGWEPTVIGGDPDLMRAALPDGVCFRPAQTTAEAGRALWASGHQDVLHTHMTAAESAAILAVGARFDRWVTTRHFAQPRGNSAFGRVISPLIRRRVDLQVAISQYVADTIDGPSVVIHNGVPSSAQPARERARTVVMMQRLEAEKDTATGLRAWSSSGLAADGWRLRIFGRGTELDRLRALAGELGVTESATFEGFVSDPRRVLAEAGIFLATAPAEPFGLSVVEAMAEGAPVVAADGGAHRETLGAAGALFAPGDAGAAAAELRALASHLERRAQLGADLKARHDTLFTVGQHVTQLEAAYAP